MKLLPLFLNSEGMECLLVGGGKIALHKLRVMLPGKPKIKVVAPEILPEIQSMPVEICLRKVEEQDLDGIQLVIDASGDAAVGRRLADLCRERKILLNVVDRPALCSFIFPAVLRRGKLTAAVSTAGASPIAAAWVRDRVDEILPECFDEILEQMESLRPIVREKIAAQENRSRFLKSCFSAAVKKGGALSDKELEALWRCNL